MQGWNDFYVATAGAAAALAGLLFVGISINITKILEYPALPTRASVSLILLMSILLFSILLLMPLESIQQKGIPIVILGLIICFIVTKSNIKMVRKTDNKYKSQIVYNCILDQTAVLPYLVGSVLLLKNNQSGFYWIAAAFIFSFIKAVSDAWVLLIEILR